LGRRFAFLPVFYDIRPTRAFLARKGKSKKHNVYVVELDEAVLRDAKFCAANPNFDPYLSCLYVGMTGLDPEVRFENHKRGYKACRYVTKYGLHLCPQMYEYFNPMTYEDAYAKEIALAKELRAEGYAVWQN